MSQKYIIKRYTTTCAHLVPRVDEIVVLFNESKIAVLAAVEVNVHLEGSKELGEGLFS